MVKSIPAGQTGTSYKQTQKILIGQTVKSNSGGSRDGKNYINYLQDISTLVYNYISIMQGALIVLISTYVWNQGQASPLVGDNQPLPSKYSVQLFDCGVPGKIQMLQILETCEDKSPEGERAQLRETYVLSPRKLKKTTGVMCRAVVSEFRGYCGAYSHWKFQQTPVIEKSVPVTPEICNKAWREGIVTLPDLTTRSIRVGDSVLYDYVPQGIIRVDSQVTSCQGTQVRLGSQMVEESLVLSQYRFELTEEEFIIKEDGEMEASVNRISLAASCHLNQGSCVSSESVFLWTQPQQHCNFLRVHRVETRIEGNLWIDSAAGYLFNVSHPRTLNEQACPPIQIYATDIPDLYVTQDPLAVHLLEVDALNVEEDMDLLPSLKFLAHNTGKRLSQLEGRLARNGCSLKSKFPSKEIRRWQ